MSLTDQLLSALLLYGLPVLFGTVLLAASGIPLPATLMLIAGGSFVEQDALGFWHVVSLALAAAVLGDQFGYGIGRWGDRRLAARLARWAGNEARLAQARNSVKRWGGPAVFLSRWLLTPLGPAINLASGAGRYPWSAFVVYDVAGEALWVLLCVLLGYTFSDRVQALANLLGELVWVVLGLTATVVLGCSLLHHLKRPPSSENL